VVAQAPGDGYQLLLQNSALVMGELLLDDARPQMLFRQVRPVVMLGVAPSILVMRTQAPGANFSDWLRLARSDGVDVASCGNGKAQHFALTLMTSGFGLNLRHIPYNTCAQAVWGVLSGTVASGLVTIEVALPQIRSGKLTALAVTSRERFQPLAQVPSLHELGLQDFDLVTWYGVFAPKSLSPDLAARLFEDIRATLRESAAAPAERAITYVVKDGAEFNKQIEQDFLLYQRLSGGGKR
jgi:tripartite-type tricarboxylate transporter receptor subunit TctC